MWFDQGIDLGYEPTEPSPPSAANLGYEEVVPGKKDLGYGDAKDLGYGDTKDLGYGSAKDLGYENPNDLGYGDTKDLGYGESQYGQYGDPRLLGYGDAPPGKTLLDDVSSKSKKKTGKKKNAEQPRRRRSVGFKEENEVHEVKLDELPAEEIWYTKEDYDTIKMKNSQIARKCMSGDYERSEDDDSVRGLEHKLRNVSRARRENKFDALNAVMEEQDRQLMRGISDPAKIAAAYRSVASRCQDKASLAGLKDAENSLNFPNFNRVRSDDEDDCRSVDSAPIARVRRPKTKGRLRRRLSLGMHGTSKASSSASSVSDAQTPQQNGSDIGPTPNRQYSPRRTGSRRRGGTANEVAPAEAVVTEDPKKKTGTAKGMIKGAKRMIRRASM